ncbi:MAG: M24 family metallopeptidase [Actinomycetota bacterium]
MNRPDFADRWRRLTDRLSAAGADALLLGGGADLEYLTGYHAMPLERLTALVGRTDDERPTLLVPELERARVTPNDAFTTITWSELENPVTRALEVLGGCSSVVISDDLWATHVLSLTRQRPELEVRTVAESIVGIRAVKAPAEMEALQAVGALADKVMAQVQDGTIPLVGRTEAEIATSISEQLLAVGHESVQFVIVASGPNSASPHHHPGDRVVERNEMVLFDFGGTHAGYNSDTTRCVHTGPIPDDVRAAYDALMEAQQRAVEAATTGNRLCDVDIAARSVLSDAGHGEAFVHRTGHGIGTEVHEQPYVTGANTAPIEVGHAFSIEPGVYYEGRWGMRLEDIVVIGRDGDAIRCNHSIRELIELD